MRSQESLSQSHAGSTRQSQRSKQESLLREEEEQEEEGEEGKVSEPHVGLGVGGVGKGGLGKPITLEADESLVVVVRVVSKRCSGLHKERYRRYEEEGEEQYKERNCTGHWICLLKKWYSDETEDW